MAMAATTTASAKIEEIPEGGEEQNELINDDDEDDLYSDDEEEEEEEEEPAIFFDNGPLYLHLTMVVVAHVLGFLVTCSLFFRPASSSSTSFSMIRLLAATRGMHLGVTSLLVGLPLACSPHALFRTKLSAMAICLTALPDVLEGFVLYLTQNDSFFLTNKNYVVNTAADDESNHDNPLPSLMLLLHYMWQDQLSTYQGVIQFWVASFIWTLSLWFSHGMGTTSTHPGSRQWGFLGGLLCAAAIVFEFWIRIQLASYQWLCDEIPRVLSMHWMGSFLFGWGLFLIHAPPLVEKPQPQLTEEDDPSLLPATTAKEEIISTERTSSSSFGQIMKRSFRAWMTLLLGPLLATALIVAETQEGILLPARWKQMETFASSVQGIACHAMPPSELDPLVGGGGVGGGGGEETLLPPNVTTRTTRTSSSMTTGRKTQSSTVRAPTDSRKPTTRETTAGSKEVKSEAARNYKVPSTDIDDMEDVHVQAATTTSSSSSSKDEKKTQKTTTTKTQGAPVQAVPTMVENEEKEEALPTVSQPTPREKAARSDGGQQQRRQQSAPTVVVVKATKNEEQKEEKKKEQPSATRQEKPQQKQPWWRRRQRQRRQPDDSKMKRRELTRPRFERIQDLWHMDEF